MTETAEIYKSETRASSIPPCNLDISYLKKLFRILYDANEEAKEYAVKEIKRENSPSDEKYAEFKDLVQSAYKLMISVSGANGEFFASYDDTIFDEINLPDRITHVVFGNLTYFKSQLNMEPAYKIEVTLDFSKPSIFDLSIKPSDQTPNISYTNITGLNPTWVKGTYENIISSLRDRKREIDWLHQKNIYDLFVWLGIIPLTFYYLHKFNSTISSLFDGMTQVLLVGIYLYSFIMILLVFMTFFKYARWLFPYLEIRSNIVKGAIVHRFVFFSIFLGVLSSIAYDLIKYALK